MESANIKYLPAADHIRAYAALLIMLYHGTQLFLDRIESASYLTPDKWPSTINPFYAVVYEGHTAVALFMVLSGFIFTFGSMGHTIKYYEFMRNRYLRIYPLFLFLVFAGALTYSDTVTPRKLLEMVVLLRPSLNFGAISAMFWTIYIEFQFYFIFPLLLYIMRRYGIKSMLGLIVLAFLIRVALVWSGYENARDLAYWSIAGRIDQFILGMIAAQIFSTLDDRKGKVLLVASSIGVLLMLLVFNMLGGWPRVAHWKLVWPTIEGAVWAAFLISYLMVFSKSKLRIFSFISKIGEISYSMYLLHFIVLFNLCNYRYYLVFDTSPKINALINTVVIFIPMVCVISFFSNRAIERPYLRLRRKWKVLQKTR